MLRVIHTRDATRGAVKRRRSGYHRRGVTLGLPPLVPPSRRSAHRDVLSTRRTRCVTSMGRAMMTRGVRAASSLTRFKSSRARE